MKEGFILAEKRPARRLGLLLASTALAAIALSPATSAQNLPQPAVAVSAAGQREFDIAPQSLTTALTQFGQQSGRQITADGAIVRDLSTPGAHGRTSSDDALQRLLAGTGLTYTITGGGTISLQKLQPAAATGIMLPPVQVEGQTTQGTGGVNGYVATQSSSGTKTSTPLIETPQSISVVTRKQLQQQNAQSVAQALAYSPGVATGTVAGYDTRFDWVDIRGFNESVEGDYRDGLRQSVGVGSVFSKFGTEPYGLERIDVVRGPTSVLYGQNLPGGLIDRISKTPTEQPFGEATINLGSYDRYQGQFDLGGPMDASGNVLYRLTGLFRDSDAEFPRFKDNRYYIAPAITWKIDDDTKLTILTNFEKDQTGVGTVGRAANGQLTHTYVDDPTFSHFNRQQYEIGYKLEHRFNDIFTARQSFRYGRLALNFNALNELSATGYTISRYAQATREGLNTYSLDNQLEADFQTGPIKHTALVGFDYFRSTVAHTSNIGLNVPTLNLLAPVYNQVIPAPSAATPQSTHSYQTLNQYGIYLQDQLKYDRLILLLSGRQDWAQSDTFDLRGGTQTPMFDKAMTGRAGLLYASDIGLSPYVSVATSFVPNVGTDFASRPLEPTTGQQEEVGLKYQPSGFNSFITLSLFNLTEQNVLVADPAHTGFSTQTGEIRSRGVELEGRADLGMGLSLIGTYTYDDVRNTKSSPASTIGKRPIDVPDQIASVWGDYTFALSDTSNLGFGAGIRYVGPTWADAVNTQSNPAFGYLDLAAHYTVGPWQLAVNATNVFDRRGATCASATNCAENEGRVVIGQLTRRW